MNEARVPNYTAVPCPLRWCISNPGQRCPTGTSHRERRQLWVALREAQSKGRYDVWWFGRNFQIRTPLRQESR